MSDHRQEERESTASQRWNDMGQGNARRGPNPDEVKPVPKEWSDRIKVVIENGIKVTYLPPGNPNRWCVRCQEAGHHQDEHLDIGQFDDGEDILDLINGGIKRTYTPPSGE